MISQVIVFNIHHNLSTWWKACEALCSVPVPRASWFQLRNKEPFDSCSCYLTCWTPRCLSRVEHLASASPWDTQPLLDQEVDRLRTGMCGGGMCGGDVWRPSSWGWQAGALVDYLPLIYFLTWILTLLLLTLLSYSWTQVTLPTQPSDYRCVPPLQATDHWLHRFPL